MSKIFGTLTLVTLAIACFIGLKNKNAYKVEIENRQTTEEALAKTEARRNSAITDRDETKAEKEAVLAEIPKVEAQRDEQQKANEELTKAKEAKATEAEGNKAKLDQAREKTEGLGNIRDLAGKLGTLINESKELDDSVASSETKLASLTTENSRVEAQVAEQRKQVELRSKGESFPSLRTRVTAVYPNWGFVTLAAGNAAGVITNSTLDVIRDDEVVAKLLVTAVERNSSSASIIPDTMNEDVTLSPGDLVVPGAKVTPPATPGAASSKTVPAPAN
ncbi:MAG: hypothetical protein EOP87_18215 [Verrucomicrobiaceae bacterium]|nr:MAG: hypothetical protein EOP87_18215 [Verrucomicrobiaceae bacterium]